MKRLATVGLAGLLLAASAGLAGHQLSARNADTPECCKNKEACCPGSSCCSGGERSGHQCPLGK